MSPDEVADVLEAVGSRNPGAAWDRTGGFLRTAVEYRCLRVAYYTGGSTRLGRASRLEVIPGSGDLRAPWDHDVVVPRSSLVFDDAGRLCSYSMGGLPLEAMLFVYDAPDGSWRAIGEAWYSNTSIRFQAANAQALSRLPDLGGRGRTESDLEESRFVVGDVAHPMMSRTKYLARGATVVHFVAVEVKRSTLGVAPSKVVLEGAGHEAVELLETHVPRCDHPMVDLILQADLDERDRRRAMRSELT